MLFPQLEGIAGVRFPELGNRSVHQYASVCRVLFSYFYFSVGKEMILKTDFKKICCWSGFFIILGWALRETYLLL